MQILSSSMPWYLQIDDHVDQYALQIGILVEYLTIHATDSIEALVHLPLEILNHLFEIFNIALHDLLEPPSCKKNPKTNSCTKLRPIDVTQRKTSMQ